MKYVITGIILAAIAVIAIFVSEPAPHPSTPATLDFEMVHVQGGTFVMGSPASEKGRNENEISHRVTLSSFLIGKYEVTQQQWEMVMGNNPSTSNKGETYPVENVSWNEAQEFLQKLNERTGKHYRLPTEAEWEYAARGGEQSNHYIYSGSNSAYEVAWYAYNSEAKTHIVGQKKPNEIGIYDMTGNVWEWCSDWYATYYDFPQTDPQGFTKGTTRVLRGGSWGSTEGSCRSANRYGGSLDKRGRNIGFRIAASL
ncbi:MAG: formylglycine-generating enzyme family protein [Prevotellaceae bacterium]|jgi:formylglycine-generating enzyme required for sulfatase activity|nr:formylglycine-generating enzyme family protein [Prevotellaceae bacterium]